MFKRFPKVIVEGTRLTGKTDLAFALNEHPRIVGARKYRYHAPIISAEWNGLTREAWGASLINFEPEHEPIVLETYRTWARLFELYPYYSWIVDRFHLSTQTSRWLYAARRYDFRWLEERLAPLGFRVVFCWREPASFAAARERRLAVSSNPSQYDDLSLFVREQETLQEFFDQSLLPKLVVEATDSNIPRMASEIADWLEATGGLTEPD
ncbi:MAG TPA: hypothetical protein VGD78_19660 [Chthoniobacterales bacterium]